MPYYDYRCPECGPFDRRRPISECTLTSPCPKCGTEAARMLSAPHVGGGSAASDYAPACGAGSGVGGGGCGSGGCGHLH